MYFRLTSYINPRRVNLPRPEPFDLYTSKEKDGVYVPDPEQMCSSLLQWFLANPGKDLPAGYSSFVLHILESHRRITMTNEELKAQIGSLTEEHRHTTAQLHHALQLHSGQQAYPHDASAGHGENINMPSWRNTDQSSSAEGSMGSSPRQSKLSLKASLF